MRISSFFIGLLLSVSAFAANLEVEIKGMTCGMCIDAITKELKATEKVTDISVNMEEEKARFTELKDKKISDGEVRAAIKKAGYQTSKIKRY